MVACAAVVVSGCGMSDDVMATIGMPPSETAAAGTSTARFGQRPVLDPREEPGLVVTPVQRVYLDALNDAGVQPASELSALSIGSYVCQARAANHGDQSVWNFVLPMVRDDVHDSHGQSVAPPAGEVNSVAADYIRIATDQLC